MKKFYDTSSLLKLLHSAFKEPFVICNITLKELENIKTSAAKDNDVKYQARQLIHLLDEHEDQYTVCNFDNNWLNTTSFPFLSDNNDSKIILTAYYYNLTKEQVIFVTEDLCCKQLAKTIGLNTEYVKTKKQDYYGYKEIVFKSDDQLADLYSHLSDEEYNWNLLENQYLIIKNSNNEIIDKYIYTNHKLEQIPFICLDTKAFGKIKPKDEYQQLALHSFKNNKLTMIRGSAGTGKSFLALGYLFYLLEKGRIDKIIIFCNPVATTGSAKLGFYKGTRTEKLLDSQIGNFLASKLGDRIEVERLVAENQIELLPMSDIRGYDTSGLNAGIYITEAQNLDVELMRLALQRIGNDSICILDGDTEAQLDLPLYAGDNNGMRRVSEVFRGDSVYGEVTLQNIYRSHIAQVAELM